MPSQVVHEKIDKMIFGQAYPEIHQHKDEPFQQMGLFHRIVRHDPLYAFSCPEPTVSLVHDFADIMLLPFAPVALLVDPRLVL